MLCEKCGATIATGLNGRQRRAIELLQAYSKSELYQTYRLTEYCISYSASGTYAHLSRDDVDGLLQRGLIVPKWPDAPDAQCWVLAPTIN